MPTIDEYADELGALKRKLEQGGPMETIRLSGLAPLGLGAQAADEQGLSWIEVMPVADKARNGPHYFTITADDLEAAAEFIKQNPDRIPIDYDHAGSEGGSTKAAGWFTGNAEVRDGSLWAEVKWTPAAVQEIRDGSFRFVSPEWAMQNKDPKTGLWTKFKELAAATLTNRPFFSEMAAVKASELSEDEALAALTGLTADDIEETLRAAVWTTSYINDLPDSAFLYIEAGGSKDSDGKTEPRSLRHFPVRDASGSVDVAHVRNALARIPQANVPAAAKESAIAKARRLLSDAGGNPSATDQGNPDDHKETTVAETDTSNEGVTDYMKALGLSADMDPKHKLATAFRDKDEQILKLTQQVTELTAAGTLKDTQAQELASRLEELEKKDRARDIEVILARAVEKGRVLPAEKETLAEVFAADVDGLRKMIATRPAEMFNLEAKGTGTSEPDRFVDDPDVSQYVKSMNTGGDPVDTEQAKQHLAAMQILSEQGKADTYTDDEYIAAYNKAATLVY